MLSHQTSNDMMTLELAYVWHLVTIVIKRVLSFMYSPPYYVS